MKLTKDQEAQVRLMAFSEKSNKEIAESLGIKVADVHAARSRLGITIPKVKAAKSEIIKIAQSVVADRKVKRTAEEITAEITAEITKVEKAHVTAKKKVDRCMERLEALYEELVNAHDNNE